MAGLPNGWIVDLARLQEAARKAREIHGCPTWVQNIGGVLFVASTSLGRWAIDLELVKLSRMEGLIRGSSRRPDPPPCGPELRD